MKKLGNFFRSIRSGLEISVAQKIFIYVKTSVLLEISSKLGRTLQKRMSCKACNNIQSKYGSVANTKMVDGCLVTLMSIQAQGNMFFTAVGLTMDDIHLSSYLYVHFFQESVSRQVIFVLQWQFKSHKESKLQLNF